MNEAEWLTSSTPRAMLEWAANRERYRSVSKTTGPQGMWSPLSDRPLRLFACACKVGTNCPWDYGDEGEEIEGPVIDVVVQWASPRWEWQGDKSLAEKAAILRDIVGNPFRPVTLGHPPYVTPLGQVWPGTLPPWLTPTVLSLAQAAYEKRGGVCGECKGTGRHHPYPPYSCQRCNGTGRIDDGTLDPVRLMVLADALEEAGCDNEEILRHLRGWERCPRCLDGGWVDVRHEAAVGVPLTRQRRTRAGNRGGGKHARQHGSRLELCEECCGERLVPLRGPHVRGCWVLDLLTGRE